MQNHYINLAEWHRRRGSTLRPPRCCEPVRTPHWLRLADGTDPDDQYTDWIVQVAQYLEGLDAESRRQLQQFKGPVRSLRTIASRFDDLWFNADKLRRLVDARTESIGLVNELANDLLANVAIMKQYSDAAIQSADRAQSPEAQEALQQIAELTHADEVVL